MPQMEKFGYASAATTVTSAPGSSSRARSAALIPASLPPIMTRCMAGSRSGRPVDGLVALVRDDDASGLRRGEAGIQRPDDHHGQGATDDLSGDERRNRRRGDAGEGGGEHP